MGTVTTATVSEDPELATVAGLLADETARTILAETSIKPMSASRLTERCAASNPTIYRRLESLRACDLLVERTRLDPDRGHHRTVYATNFRRVTVELRDGEFAFDLDRREDMADRFTRLVEEM